MRVFILDLEWVTMKLPEGKLFLFSSIVGLHLLYSNLSSFAKRSKSLQSSVLPVRSRTPHFQIRGELLVVLGPSGDDLITARQLTVIHYSPPCSSERALFAGKVVSSRGLVEIFYLPVGNPFLFEESFVVFSCSVGGSLSICRTLIMHQAALRLQT